MSLPDNNDDHRFAPVAAADARIEGFSSVAGTCSKPSPELPQVSKRACQAIGSMPATRQDLAAGLRRVAQGDRAALELVYEATSPQLYGIVVRILGRRDAADEVLRQVYVRVWQRAGDFDPASCSPITWLATIARNLALDQARRDTAGSREDFPAPPQGLGGDGASAAHEQSEECRRLHVCLEGLGRERRAVVLLVYHYGMTHEEISNRFGQPIAMVRSWLRLSLTQLKDCLGR